MKKLFIIFAILCLAAPAMAADWNFYGNYRHATWYVDDDYDFTTADGYSDDTDLQWENGGNSRIGATVEVNDQIGGGVEIGFDVGSLDMYTRKIYGTYTMANGSQLLFGQTYTPLAMFYSNSVYGGDGDLLGIGEFYDGRWPMVQWKSGGFKVALVTPREVGQGVGQPDVDYTLPKFEASFGFKSDVFFLDVAAGYQTYTLDGGDNGDDYDIDSYIGVIGAGANFGALYVKAQAHMGQNLGNFGSSGPYVVSGWFGADSVSGENIPKSAVFEGNDYEDSDALGFLGVVGFNASEMLSFEGGVGYQNYEVDLAADDVDFTLMQYYVQATINIAPGFFIVPEVGMITLDPGGDNPPEPERFYAGAKWQINF
jgi:hypothetical protein